MDLVVGPKPKRQSKKIRQKIREIEVAVMQQCKGCGKAFEPTSENQNYCGPTCKRRIQRKKKTAEHRRAVREELMRRGAEGTL